MCAEVALFQVQWWNWFKNTDQLKGLGREGGRWTRRICNKLSWPWSGVILFQTAKQNWSMVRVWKEPLTEVSFSHHGWMTTHTYSSMPGLDRWDLPVSFLQCSPKRKFELRHWVGVDCGLSARETWRMWIWHFQLLYKVGSLSPKRGFDKTIRPLGLWLVMIIKVKQLPVV